jgi:hypothetical protein
MISHAGLGDDQHDLGPDFVIDSWLEKFWNLALEIYPLPTGVQPARKEISLKLYEDQN